MNDRALLSPTLKKKKNKPSLKALPSWNSTKVLSFIFRGPVQVELNPFKQMLKHCFMTSYVKVQDLSEKMYCSCLQERGVLFRYVGVQFWAEGRKGFWRDQHLQDI